MHKVEVVSAGLRRGASSCTGLSHIARGCTGLRLGAARCRWLQLSAKCCTAEQRVAAVVVLAGVWGAAQVVTHAGERRLRGVV